MAAVGNVKTFAAAPKGTRAYSDHSRIACMTEVVGGLAGAQPWNE
jgi:hypothetical protein